jgi:hypothetical protein
MDHSISMILEPSAAPALSFAEDDDQGVDASLLEDMNALGPSVSFLLDQAASGQASSSSVQPNADESFVSAVVEDQVVRTEEKLSKSTLKTVRLLRQRFLPNPSDRTTFQTVAQGVCPYFMFSLNFFVLSFISNPLSLPLFSHCILSFFSSPQNISYSYLG